MKLSMLLGSVQSQTVTPVRKAPADPEITGISSHSRWIQPGHLFVMVKGHRNDGRRFAQQAARQGASAILGGEAVEGLRIPQYVVGDVRAALADLASEFYGEPSRALTCIGITGTNGKSTTAYLLSSIYRTYGDNPGMMGTLGHGIFGALVPGKNTTPDAVTVQRLMREFIERRSGAVVMEVSSHAIDQERVRSIHFDAAVFTNLTRDHLDYHATFDQYMETKARLFDELSPTALAVVNADDPSATRMALATRGNIMRYGIDAPDIEWRGRILEADLRGTRFEVRGPSLCSVFHTRLMGVHNVYNCLSSIATSASLGVDEHSIRCGIEAVTRVPGRLEKITAPGRPTVFVDFAHTDDALDKVLSSLKAHVPGKLYALFGAGGDRDQTKRPRMGRAAGRHADEIFLTSDNPRSEDPLEILEQVRAGTGGTPCRVILDRRAAIETAISEAGEQDVILIAGKGHETFQAIGDSLQPFDDREVAREVLSST